MIVDGLTVMSGALVGLLLGLLGGGGSILAVPLLLYVVGINDPHVAIGTSAAAVAFSAAANLALHARARNVKWPCALVFAACGILGALAGAWVAQRVDGAKLLLAFAAAMLGVAISLLRRPAFTGDPLVHINPTIAQRLIPAGLATGFASGFFGIGGGFLIVPGLIAAANMTFLHAVGSSLVAVTAFSAATAVSYAHAGLVQWKVAVLFVVGGFAGGFLGQRAGRHLAQQRHTLVRVFAGIVIATAFYIALKTLL
jgi:uncharacterized membrane protein YfcA